ncbi:alpha/beta-hydrolase [Apiospora rasikravindrae]|uniref:Alpha/beta-hydrolase n=1 Tax=Apiospora rasikravindrae TaxID=990691 RepID=A0ABR1SPA5_9PEZI
MQSFLKQAAGLFALLTGAAAIDCSGINALSPKCKSTEAAYTRDFFYVGGDYVASTVPGQSIFTGQMYVEKLTPVTGVNQTYPLVFVSAGVPSGTVWLNTPDNRKGWASYFVEAGYQVYIVDITGNGRSGQNDVAAFPLRFGSTDNITQDGFTAPKLAAHPYPQAVGHNKWPGSGVRGDPIFDAFQASIVPLTGNSTNQELSMRAAGCALLSIIGESVTFCHSGSCQYTVLMADECPDLIRAGINLEPTCLPFQSMLGDPTGPDKGRLPSRPYGFTNTPLTYDPPIASAAELHPVEVGVDTPELRSCFLQSANGTVRHTLPQVAKVPFVMYTASASPHITYDHCVALYLNQTGVPYAWTKLGDVGITGNGHFFFLETNNLEIAAVVEADLQKLGSA